MASRSLRVAVIGRTGRGGTQANRALSAGWSLNPSQLTGGRDHPLAA